MEKIRVAFKKHKIRGKTMAARTKKSSSTAKSDQPKKTEQPKTAAKAVGDQGGEPTAKPIATKTPPEPAVVMPGPVVSAPEMRKKELIDLVVERSGVKKKDAKPVVEAMLAVLGETIGEGRELNMQPLGKLRINRSELRNNGRVIICKIRQSIASTSNLSEVDKTVSD
ncbi:HU family DNA-binding protein [Parasedimentitalea huanghaiensis]|nr:HU family DNA-binding protein [Zongyanglinia huanghaiensis]